MQLNTYDYFYTGGIEKPHNKAIVKGNKREVFFKCQGNVGATTLGAKVSPFFGLREDSERRLQIQYFHINNEFLMDVMFYISLAISHVQSVLRILTNLKNPKTITDLNQW